MNQNLLAIKIVIAIAIVTQLLALSGIVLHNKTDYAAEINIAGQQRYLSQRIAMISNKLSVTDRQTLKFRSLHELLLAAVTRMQNQHQALINGSVDLGLMSALSEELHNIYFGNYALDRKVKSYLDKAISFAEAAHSGNSDVDTAELANELHTIATHDLISILDLVVWQLQQEAETVHADNRTLSVTVIVLLNIALFLAGLIYFMALKKMHRDNRKLNLDKIALDNAVEGFITTDSSGLIRSANSAVKKLIGYEPKSLKMRSLFELIDHLSGTEDHSEIIRTELDEKGEWRGELVPTDTELPTILLSISSVFVRQSKVGSYVAILIDISNQKAAEAQLREQSVRDHLTGLLNREAFYEALDHEQQIAVREQNKLALVMIDFDDFKQVNDNHGHQVGDQILVAIATRIVPTVRASDIFARIGGDEFVIVYRRPNSRDELEKFAQKLVEQVNHPLTIDTGDVQVSISVGVAIFPDDAEDISQLVALADSEMYKAKQQGRNTYSVKLH